LPSSFATISISGVIFPAFASSISPMNRHL
jgi:hypothetical protein